MRGLVVVKILSVLILFLSFQNSADCQDLNADDLIAKVESQCAASTHDLSNYQRCVADNLLIYFITFQSSNNSVGRQTEDRGFGDRY